MKLKPRKGKKRSRKIALYRHNLVALDATTGGLRKSFVPAVNGSVAALAQTSSALYFAGRFRLVGGRRRDGMAAVDPKSGKPVGLFSPQPAGGDVRALLADGARVYAAGAFAGFGLVPRANFAILPVGAPPS